MFLQRKKNTISFLTVFLVCVSLLFLSLFSIGELGSITTVKNGKSSGEFYKFCIDNPQTYINLDGGCLHFESVDSCLKIIEKLGAKEVHYFSDGEIENYYFYSEKLPKKEIIANKKVNVHLAIKSSGATLGFPLIYYGY